MKTVEPKDGGFDEVRTTATRWKLDENVESLVYTGTGNFTGMGTSQNDIITGNQGNDILEGGDGADQLIGGEGHDVASYADSPVPMTFNFTTNEHSGFAIGDTLTDIETIRGSLHGDTFISGPEPNNLDGHTGLDVIDYSASPEAISVDLSGKTPGKGGDAEGDVLVNIEIVKGTPLADTLVGGVNADHFIGGDGADRIDGGSGNDGAWYVTSKAAVSVDLASGKAVGGEAEGDVLISIENLMGSSFDDTLTGDNAANTLEGGSGNDSIYGGPGNDTLYGHIKSPTGPVKPVATEPGEQADTLHGGSGNDTVESAERDKGTVMYGDAGDDTLTVNHGVAHGGDGDDRIHVRHGVGHGGDGDDFLTGWTSGYVLNGDEGNDTFELFRSGIAYGGEGSDRYIVQSVDGTGIRDEGTQGRDVVVLSQIPTLEDVRLVSDGLNCISIPAISRAEAITTPSPCTTGSTARPPLSCLKWLMAGLLSWAIRCSAIEPLNIRRFKR
jgi:Ca2+-binding RTX toxin-like protein